VLVVARGDTALFDLYGRTATNFPQDDDGVYPGFTPAHGQAAVAHLEALRAKGATHLLVPETSRWWLDHFVPFAEHLDCRYAVVEDRPEVGVLTDLRRRRPTTAGWSQSLNGLLERIGAAGGSPPAVLDWTDLDLAQRLPGRNLFVPPTPSDILPYLDRTIDVVVIDAHRPATEARRVAAGAVVTIARDRTGTHRIVDVEVIAPVLRSATEPAVGVVVGDSVARDPGAPPLEDRQALEEALAGEDNVECFEAPTGELPPEALEADIVALVEPGVVPLPGCIVAARTALASDDDLAAVAVKLFAPDGSLEAAGATVFADGSIRGIAGGSHDACGAWHEYVRPVCGGLGLLFLRTAAVQKLADQQRFGSVPSLGWGAALWSAGWRVQYRPEATAVRLVPARGPATTALDPAERRAWAPALTVRPDLPVALDEQAWRRILADDAVEEAWR
jgi:hypothetical protein